MRRLLTVLSVFGGLLLPNNLRADVTFVASSNASSAAGDSVSPTIPTGTQANDFMLASCILGNFVGTGNWAETAATGWTRLHNGMTTSGDDRTTAIFHKFAGGSESAPTFDSQVGGVRNVSCQIHSFRGVHLTVPFDVTFADTTDYATGINQNNPTNPAITTNAAKAWVVLVHFSTQDDIVTAGAPTGYTLQGSIVGASHNHRQQEVATKEIASPALETPGAWTNTAGTVDDYSVYTLALRPAPPAGASIHKAHGVFFQ